MEELWFRYEGGRRVLQLVNNWSPPASGTNDEDDWSESSAPPELSDSVLPVGLISTGKPGDSVNYETQQSVITLFKLLPSFFFSFSDNCL